MAKRADKKYTQIPMRLAFWPTRGQQEWTCLAAGSHSSLSSYQMLGPSLLCILLGSCNSFWSSSSSPVSQITLEHWASSGSSLLSNLLYSSLENTPLTSLFLWLNFLYLDQWLQKLQSNFGDTLNSSPNTTKYLWQLNTFHLSIIFMILIKKYSPSSLLTSSSMLFLISNKS